MGKNIVIADGSTTHLKAICTLLEDKTDCQVIAAISRWEELLSFFTKTEEQVDILLLDLELNEDFRTSTQFLLWLRTSRPDLAIVILSLYAIGNQIHQMQLLGIQAFLLKDCEAEELILAVKTIAKGVKYYQKAVLKIANRYEKYKNLYQTQSISLTPTEKQIIRFCIKGFTAEEVSRLLQLGKNRYDYHWKNLYKKFSSKDVGHIIQLCIQRGLLNGKGEPKE